MNVKKIVIIAVFSLILQLLGQPVLAQEAVSPQLYKSLEEQKLLQDALKGRDPSEVPQGEMQQILDAVKTSSTVSYSGGVTTDGSKYVFMTGLSGSARGMVPLGEYEVRLSPIKDIVIRLPQKQVLIDGVTNKGLMVGIHRDIGEGRIVYSDPGKKVSFISYQLTKLQNFITQLFTSILPKQSPKTAVAGTTSATVPLTVTLFQDANDNGIKDVAENPVQWANVPVILTKISAEETKSLDTGENIVIFSILPKNIKSAHDLILGAVTNGASYAELTAKVAGRNKVVSAEGLNVYGENFPLEKNHEYKVTVSSPVTLTLIR